MFCSKCGHDAQDANFCPSCGAPMGSNTQPTAPPQANGSFEEMIIWEGQPSSVMDKAKGAAKLNDVRYIITNQRLIIKSGLIGKKETEVDFKNIKDYKVDQSIAERVQGIGNLIVFSTDASSPKLELKNIEKPADVKEILRKAVMEYKQKMGIQSREIF